MVKKIGGGVKPGKARRSGGAAAGGASEGLWGPGHDKMPGLPWEPSRTVMLLRLVAGVLLAFYAWQIYMEDPKRREYEVYDKVVLAETYGYDHEVCDKDKGIDDETRCTMDTVVFKAGTHAVVVRVPGYEEDSPAVIQIDDYQLNAPPKGIVQFDKYEKDPSLVKPHTDAGAGGGEGETAKPIKAVDPDLKVEL